MRSDTLSILGLYNYDNTIFDLLTIPEGLDKTILIKSICAELADMELLYPNSEVMKDLIGVWSAGCQYEWAKLLESMNFEYNPIDNYDRTETRTLTSQGTGSGTDGGSDSYSTTKQHTGQDSQSGQEQNTGKVTAFNSSTLTDKNQDTGTNSNTLNSSHTDTETATNNYGKTKQETFSKSDSETIRAHGNIGVTTTMQMIREQRDIVKFNLYDIITEEFKLRFCILVY